MSRPRTDNPSLEAMRMRAVRERARCGIVRLWLEVDLRRLRERLVDTGRMSEAEFADRHRLESLLNELIDDMVERL